jgi:hypothetical protein
MDVGDPKLAQSPFGCYLLCVSASPKGGVGANNKITTPMRVLSALLYYITRIAYVNIHKTHI